MRLQSEFSFRRFHIRINWLVAACVIMTALSCGRLGLWQLERAAQKVEAQRLLQRERRENAGAIEAIPPAQLRRANPELQNRHVALRGEYDNARTILLTAEFFDGQIGYGVVTPFRLAGNGQLVLVSRGWTTGILAPDTPPYLGEVEGPLELTAQIHVAAENAPVLTSRVDPGVWPLRIRSLEIDVLSEILGEPLFPFELRLIADQPGALARHWPAVNADINQNLFYAVQWFSFALVVLFVTVLASSNLWRLMRESGRRPI